MPRKPEIGEILYITNKEEDLLGIYRERKLEKVEVVSVFKIDHKYKLWKVEVKTIDTTDSKRIGIMLNGWAGKTFLWKDFEPKEKVSCSICGSEEDFCICKLLMQ